MTGNPCYLECGFVGIREEPIQRETVCFGEVKRLEDRGKKRKIVYFFVHYLIE